MSETFISYKREDLDRARQLYLALKATGFEVWWDERLQGGQRWEPEIDQRLLRAAAVVVLWSPLAAQSDWVKHEASVGKVNSVLIPTIAIACEIPHYLSSIQAIDLTNWKGSERDPNFQDVCKSLRRALRKRRVRGLARAVAAGGLTLVGALAGVAVCQGQVASDATPAPPGSLAPAAPSSAPVAAPPSASASAPPAISASTSATPTKTPPVRTLRPQDGPCWSVASGEVCAIKSSPASKFTKSECLRHGEEACRSCCKDQERCSCSVHWKPNGGSEQELQDYLFGRGIGG